MYQVKCHHFLQSANRQHVFFGSEAETSSWGFPPPPPPAETPPHVWKIQWKPPRERDVAVCRLKDVWGEKKIRLWAYFTESQPVINTAFSPREDKNITSRGGGILYHPALCLSLLSYENTAGASIILMSGYFLYTLLPCYLLMCLVFVSASRVWPKTIVNICRNMSQRVGAVEVCPHICLWRNSACAHKHTPSVHKAL